VKLSDPIEQIIADGLDAAGIRFVHESKAKELTLSLDFYLPDFCIFIECKQFWSENLNNQMQRASNIIAIQGRAAAYAFAAMVAPTGRSAQ
jgi:hypothetical protein